MLIDNATWKPPSGPVALTPAAVHVWIADLVAARSAAGRWIELLSPDERQRGERFRFEKDRMQYVAARGILRSILGSYIGASPAELRFEYNAQGKPSLARGLDFGKLQFNIAHSHGLALFGVTLAREVGVDIERFRPDFATREIAERFFSPEEVKRLASLDATQQEAAFFDCWTRKEAFIKARGMGLSLPLNQFAVAFGPGVAPAILSAKDDSQAAARWLVRDLRPAESYAGALVVEAEAIDLQLWRFESAKT